MPAVTGTSWVLPSAITGRVFDWRKRRRLFVGKHPKLDSLFFLAGTGLLVLNGAYDSIWSPAQKRRLRQIDSLDRATFSPDGRHALFQMAFDEQSAGLVLYEPATAQTIQLPKQILCRPPSDFGQFVGYAVEPCPQAFSADGRMFVTIEGITRERDYSHVISVWEVETGGNGVPCLMVHTRSITALAFSPDGRSLVSGSSDRTALIWELYPEPDPKADTVGSASDKCWKELANERADVAFAAMRRMVRQPEHTLKLFTRRGYARFPVRKKMSLAKLLRIWTVTCFRNGRKPLRACGKNRSGSRIATLRFSAVYEVSGSNDTRCTALNSPLF
ncbi:MAG: hypothetical protein KatS3mg105_2606 [Gemmatales bacterium]|nr:MAG: hypothetical protein KatS3mg105_2606 [Gemmatales bacterium]